MFTHYKKFHIFCSARRINIFGMVLFGDKLMKRKTDEDCITSKQKTDLQNNIELKNLYTHHVPLPNPASPGSELTSNPMCLATYCHTPMFLIIK